MKEFEIRITARVRASSEKEAENLVVFPLSIDSDIDDIIVEDVSRYEYPGAD